MKRAALFGIVLLALVGTSLPSQAQTGGSSGGGGPACVTIDPTAPTQVVLGTTVTLSGTCCAAAAASVPTIGPYRWLLAALLLGLLWRFGPRSRRRWGVLAVLAWLSFAALSRPAEGGTATCALTWQAQSPYEAFTGTGAQFSFTPTVAASFQITLSSGSAVATQALTVVPPVGDWVWQSAAPVSRTLHGIWASAPNDAWAVGDGGFAMHWDGLAWQRVGSSTMANLSGIWGSSATDVWAVGGGVGGAPDLIHWNGQAWSIVSPDTSVNLSGVWGSGPSDVWAVGGSGVQGVITHFDGTAWHLSSTSVYTDFAGVWGSGPSDVWAVGDPYGPISPGESNSIVHFLGGLWSPVADNASTNQAKDLTSVWGAGAADIWAATGGGTMLHWNGTAWAPSSAPSSYYFQVWGRASNDVWAAASTGAFHFDGASWTSKGVDVQLNSVGGATAPSNGIQGVWAGGLQAVFELIPGTPLTCQAIGGTCSASCPSLSHLSDYSCAGAGSCCVSSDACGGSSEPICCAKTTGLPVATRPICHDGGFSCGPDATTICRI
jgi:hypothetical protein